MHDLTLGQLLAIWVGMSIVIATGIAAAFVVAAVAWTVLDLLV
jgi:hypothetical protein